MIHVWRGEPDQAIDAAQRSIALAEQYGFSDWRLQSMVHYGCALTAKNGDPAGAAMVGEAIGDLRRPGFVGSMPVYLSLYAGSLATLGRLDEAILVADDAISLAERTGEHTALSMARSERAGLEFRRGDPDHIAEDLLPHL